MSRRRWILLLILSALLMVTACDAETDRVDSASPDWSRALIMGHSSLNNPPALVVDDAGWVHAVWVGVASGKQALYYIRLSPAGEVEDSHALAGLDFGYPDTPRILQADAGRLHLSWITRAATADHPQGFYHVVLDTSGDVLVSPLCLSEAAEPVARHGSMCPAPGGGAFVFWSGELGPESGLYGARLNAGGEVETGPSLFMAGGAIPDVQLDAQGLVHLVWQERRTAQADRMLHYGVYNPETQELGTSGAVSIVRVGTQNALSGPTIGLTTEQVYVLWSLEARGKFSGSAQIYYLAWPLDRPPSEFEIPTELWMPTDYRPAYVPVSSLELAEGEFNYTQLAAVDEAFPGYIMQPSALPGQHEDLLVSLTMNVSTRRKSSQPIALAVFAEGEPQAYQLITRADGLSTRSALAADANGNLHAIWMSQAGTYNFEVFYASTNPAVRGTLEPWTTADLYARGLDYFWNLGVALGFFPLAMVWVFASVIWLGLAYLVFGDVELRDRRGWIILIVALLLHFFSKYFSMPGMFIFVPFIDSLPQTLVFVVGRVLTPLLLSGVGLFVMIVYLRRGEGYRGAFGAYIAFALVDIVVSLMVYIPTLLGGGV